jgi:hypothetical protein
VAQINEFLELMKQNTNLNVKNKYTQLKLDWYKIRFVQQTVRGPNTGQEMYLSYATRMEGTASTEQVS